MVNDPIGDMIIQLKNAGMAGNTVVELPYSRLKHQIADILQKEGFLKSVESVGNEPKVSLKLTLRYLGDASAITDVKRMSKPGLRMYCKKNDIPSKIQGVGIVILSTPKGVMSGVEARKVGVGGEVLCEVW